MNDKKVKRIEANEHTWLFRVVYEDDSATTYMAMTLPTGLLAKPYRKVLVSEEDPKVYIWYPVEDE